MAQSKQRALRRRFILGYRWAVFASLLAISATTIRHQPAFAEAEGNLDWVISSEDWVGGKPVDPSEEWKTSFGGRLYDKWYGALNSPMLPTKTHQAYPESGEFAGADTWRCKECHGWDYKGKDGVYDKGKHFTGIPGLRQLAGTDPEKIPEILTDETHGYTKKMIPEFAMEAVALFLTKGQHDTDLYIDRKTGKVDGDPTRGKIFYQNVCAACHGFDGKAINFLEGKTGQEGPDEFVGTIANNNPWELLHKIVNGQPGEPMPALRVLSFKDVINILAYAQKLPAE